MTFKKFQVKWLSGIKPDSFFESGFRLNGGGYTYGASPYYYWRIYKLQLRKYV
jgi:hypothetical protein